MDEKELTEHFDETRERLHREMLSSVSHDLKTPLATIIGTLEVYTRMGDKLPEDKKAMLIQSAMGEAYRLDQFITNILDMAKLENGMVKIKKERCDLASLLQDSIIRLGPRAKKGTITLKPENDKPVAVFTDPMLLSRAIGIVLDNALKHAGVQPEISITYGQDGKGGFICIQDNGPGVEKGKEEEIFSKYTRFAKGDQRNAGTGLGLAISRQLMGLLSGTIKLDSEAKCGAGFMLRFPSLD